MKTNKQNGTQRVATIGIIALAAIMVFAVIACKNDDGDNDPPPPQDLPKAQTATIHPFEDLQLTVKGTFTNAEWAGVAEKIENAIRAYITSQPSFAIAAAKSGFVNCEAIIVEKTTEYTKWKTNGDGKTIFINFGILNDNDLSNIIATACGSMNGNKAETGDPCNCPNETLHLVGETCCNSANCTCLFEHDSFHDIQVVSEKGVSDSQVETIIEHLTTIYGYFVGTDADNFAALTEIRIKTSAGISKDDTVLNIGADETVDDIADYIFNYVVS